MKRWLAFFARVDCRSVTPSIAVCVLLAITAQAQTRQFIFGRADFPVGTGAVSIARGDFNGDGIRDLAIVNEGDSTVSVLLRKSDGTFAPQVTYATGLGPLAIATGDFNGDGNLDLAVTNGDCTLQILRPPVCNAARSASYWATVTAPSDRISTTPAATSLLP